MIAPFDLAVYVQRRDVFVCMAAVSYQKFALRLFGIADLRRHERQPFFKPFAAKKAVIQLAVEPHGAAYQADVVELGNKNTNAGIYSVLDSLGDAASDLFWDEP